MKPLLIFKRSYAVNIIVLNVKACYKMFNTIFALIALVCFSTASGFLLQIVNRTFTQTLRVNNGGRYGYWGNGQFCPEGTFASGYSMKIEPNQYTGDDTALNAIRLTCSNTKGHVDTTTITSTEGPFGTWSKVESCIQPYESWSFLTRFQLQVEAPVGSSDDTSANYVKFMCRDGESGNETELVLPPGSGHWGTYGDWSQSCRDDTAICGIDTKVEEVQNDGDDTSLNDVVFYCCNIQ